MKKNAFTLIELLAVIVILAIIALIAVPIVINIIADSKKSSERESIKLYLDTVEKTIAKRQMEKPTFNPTECTINGNKITCGEEEIEVEIKGEIPKSGTIKFGKGMIISGVNIELNNLYYQVTDGEVSDGTKKPKYAILLEDNEATGISPGDKYEYEVSPGTKYTFYVLSIENDKVNLIMDRNICEDGTTNYTASNNYCRYAWHKGSDDNTYGPDTAMQGLYNATKNWTNVPNMDLSGDNKYSDEGHEENSSYGYGTIETTGLGIKITKKDKITEVTRAGNETPVIPYEDGKKLKARLPKLEEVYNDDTTDTTHCYISHGSCPAWLTSGLKQYETYYSDNEHIEGIKGYWTLASLSGHARSARTVRYEGFCGDGSADYSITGGLRPVITVSKSDLN